MNYYTLDAVVVTAERNHIPEKSWEESKQGDEKKIVKQFQGGTPFDALEKFTDIAINQFEKITGIKVPDLGKEILRAGSAPGLKGFKLFKLKPINLPGLKKLKINMEHILSRHTVNGAGVNESKTLFPSNMDAKQIEAAIKDSYKCSKKVGSKGGRDILQGTDPKSGLNIEMYLHKETKTIETAYSKY